MPGRSPALPGGRALSVALAFLLDRRRRAGRHLEWKVRIFTVGALLAVAGIYLGERWLTGAAIAVLLVGVLLRLFPARGVDPDEGSALEDPELDD